MTTTATATSPRDEGTCPVCDAVTRCGARSLGGFALHECPGCSLRFAWDAFGASVDYEATYRSDEYVREYVEQVRNPDPVAWGEIATYRPFFTHLGKGRGRRLLDVGCGVGRFASAAFHRGWSTSGIDVSEEALTAARTYVRFPVRRALIDEVAVEDERFDVVTSFEVLEHLERPIEFLRTMRGLLSPEGRVFLTVPNWDCEAVQTATNAAWLPPLHLSFFTRRALVTAAERAGFTSIEVGVVDEDPPIYEFKRGAKWIARRLLGRPRRPLGLWLLASGGEVKVEDLRMF